MMLNKDKIKKLLAEDTSVDQSISKSRFRIDILTAKYKGKVLPCDYYSSSDYEWVISRAKTLKSSDRLIAIVQIDSCEAATLVMKNKHVTSKVIEYIYFHTSHNVLDKILGHDQTPTMVLKDVIKNSKDTDDLINAINHSQTTPEMIESLIRRESRSSIMQAIAMKMDTVKWITKIYELFSDDSGVVSQLCCNEHTPTEILTAIMNSNVRPSKYIAFHDNMTPELLARLYTNISFFFVDSNHRKAVKLRLAEHPKTPVHIMKALLLEDNEYFRDEVIENSSFKLQVRQRYTARNATEVLFVSDNKVQELLNNDGTPIEMLRAIFYKIKEDENALVKLIKHANIDEDLTENIIQLNRNCALSINSKFEFYCDEEEN